MKNDQVMPNLMFMCQSSIWPILCQLMAILAKLLDMDFKFVLPSIYINFDIQTNFEVDQTQIGQKITKMAISQNPILPKCHSPKSLLLQHLSINLSENVRINVNMDFTHTNRGRFLSPKSRKTRVFFGFWALNFFGWVNAINPDVLSA